MRVAYLGSGSKGNAALVEANGTCVMLDCGFTVTEVERRMARLARDPASLAGILVTHEHSDHFAGVARLARLHGIPVWLTHGTARGRNLKGVAVNWIDVHQPFQVGELQVQPLPVPHDAQEPCQFVFGDGEKRLGILTDAGHVTRHMVQSLGGLDALLLECNHDLDMLMSGPYPARLKRRVAGKYGHLSNLQALELLRELDQVRLRQIFGLHLSEINNTPQRALDALAAGRARAAIEVAVVDQEQGLDWFSL